MLFIILINFLFNFKSLQKMSFLVIKLYKTNLKIKYLKKYTNYNELNNLFRYK